MGRADAPMKTSWTWEEWLQSRKARKAASDRITTESIRRAASSSDRRLKKAFGGQRGPAFNRES